MKHICWSLFLRSATAGFKVCNFIKKGQVLSCVYCKIFKTIYFKKHWLLFDCSNGLLLYGPKVPRPRLYDDIRLQGSSFLFLS